MPFSAVSPILPAALLYCAEEHCAHIHCPVPFLLFMMIISGEEVSPNTQKPKAHSINLHFSGTVLNRLSVGPALALPGPQLGEEALIPQYYTEMELAFVPVTGTEGKCDICTE